MKKSLIVLGIVCLILLNVNIVFAYTDTEDHWAEQDIKNLSLNIIISNFIKLSFLFYLKEIKNKIIKKKVYYLYKFNLYLLFKHKLKIN